MQRGKGHHRRLPPPPITRRLIKYGVISTDALTADLTGWTSLYAAGRLHKPVVTLTPPPRGLAAALGANVAAATAAAVLLLPPAFSAAALHATAAGLSYAGDVRSAVVAAEDPAKVDRLVAGGAAAPAGGRSAVVLAAVAAVVRSSSIGQTVKGVLTAGPATAARYALAKLRKGRGAEGRGR